MRRHSLTHNILLAAVMVAATGCTARDRGGNSGAAPSATKDSVGDADDRRGIEQTLSAYNTALNGGKTDAVIPLYTADGVFMPPYSSSAVGPQAIRKAYDAVFRELKFDVRFNVAELVQMAPGWAYVRTNSAGTTRHASSGKTGAEANQELFILRKADDGRWRIARYSFSPTNPPSRD